MQPRITPSIGVGNRMHSDGLTFKHPENRNKNLKALEHRPIKGVGKYKVPSNYPG